MGIGQRPPQQGFFPGNPNRFPGQDRQERNHETGKQTGLSGVQLRQFEAVGRSPDSRDNNFVSRYFYIRSQGFCHRQGALVVPAGRISVQVRHPVG